MSLELRDGERLLEVGAYAPEPEGDVVDRRIRGLLDEYVRLTGARLDVLEPMLLRLTLPPSEVDAFRGRAQHLIALDLDALERHPDAELLVIGSALWDDLIAAIRRRGQRFTSGCIPVTVTTTADDPDVRVVDATVELAGRRRALHRVARLTARVTIAAGTAIQEEVVRSGAIDLATGAELPESVLPLLDGPDSASTPDDVPVATLVQTDQLVPVLIRDLEEKVAGRLDSSRSAADRDLALELARIDGYYAAVRDQVIEASGPGTDAVRAVEREHEKRRGEEVRRHEVRVEVEPLQVLERGILVERATWRLTSRAGRSAELAAQRYLSGDGEWGVVCDCCRAPPQEITVCRHGHAVGTECTRECSVCAERFCTSHGHGGCAIDGAPVCDEHGAECWSCERVHCAAHAATCSEDGHAACTECLVSCGLCSRTVCQCHVVMSHEDSPRGARMLCSKCVVFCEGATSEPIGRDEAEPCGTCGKYICARHQVCCVVDGKPHCSNHIRRSDRSRRFICGSHAATCDHEQPDVVFAADEVHGCVECARVSCDTHGAACHEDQRWHCREHMVVLHDLVEAVGCGVHHSVCHVDGRTFSLAGTSACDVCDRLTCRTHAGRCAWCGGRACASDMASGGRCATCSSLRVASDIPDDVIAAVARVSPDERVKERSIARDGSRFVVQLDLGWTRRMVVVVPHGAVEPSRVLRHSLFGSKQVAA
jgi:hypothetical protein